MSKVNIIDYILGMAFLVISITISTGYFHPDPMFMWFTPLVVALASFRLAFAYTRKY